MKSLLIILMLFSIPALAAGGAPTISCGKRVHRAAALLATESARIRGVEAAIRAKELSIVEDPQYATEFLYAKTPEGKPRKTKTVALVFHGLFRSPKYMHDIALNLQAEGMNVLNVRLPGHHEKDPKALDHTSRDEWMSHAHKMMAAALLLGDRILLVGHSTGGLISTWMATLHPGSVQGLVLYAPAFRIELDDRLQSYSPIGQFDAENEYNSAHAGLEVSQLSNEFFTTWPKSFLMGPMGSVRQSLQNTPVLMINTANDHTLVVEVSENFFDDIATRDSVVRERYTVPVKDNVLHRDLARPKNNSAFPRLQEMQRDFLHRIGIGAPI